MATPEGEGDFWYEIPGVGTYHYSPIFDSIHSFPDPELDHVHYYDDEKEMFMWQFMGRAALDDLHSLGLPHTQRDKISPAEKQQWDSWQEDMRDYEELVIAREVAGLDAELEALDGGE